MDDHFIARRRAHTEGGGHDHHHHHGNGFNYYVGRFVLKVRGSVFIPVNSIEEVKLIKKTDMNILLAYRVCRKVKKNKHF